MKDLSMPSSADDLTLEELMAGYQAADADAAECLVDRVSPGLLRFFLAREATRMEAQDLLQETWLRIHRMRHTYRPDAPAMPWIYAIARHVRVDGYRKTSRLRRNEIPMSVLPEVSQPAEDRPALPTFQSLTAKLPASQRDVVTMLKVKGLSLAQIASATSSTVGAVKQKASRAYATLRGALTEESWGDGKAGSK